MSSRTIECLEEVDAGLSSFLRRLPVFTIVSTGKVFEKHINHSRPCRFERSEETVSVKETRHVVTVGVTANHADSQAHPG